MIRLISLKISSLILLCLILTFPLSLYAEEGCCSHHGGVAGCNRWNNRLLCRDGTTSPTCLCGGGTQKVVKEKHEKIMLPTKTEKPKATTTKKTTKAKKATKAKKTTQTKKAKKKAPEPITATQGCCANHGGVAGCDKRKHRMKCKDGTISSTCKC